MLEILMTLGLGVICFGCFVWLRVAYRRLGKKLPGFLRFGLWIAIVLWVYELASAVVSIITGS